MGFLMRVLFSRMLGSEIMGIMELGSSVHMMAITPATAGLPLAVSRLTAKAAQGKKEDALYTGKRLVRLLSLIWIPLYLLLTPFIARLLGDDRTFPSLLMAAPCILVLGYSAAYNGYCYGMNNAWPPAISELTEQTLRFVIAFLLLKVLPNLTAAWTASVPGFATAVSEAAGVVLVILMLRLPKPIAKPDKQTQKQVLRLALPPTATRLTSTVLRSLNAMMIPLRLRSSGLELVEATSRFGMLAGMVMPVIMLPSVFTGSLAMLATPALAARENNPKALKAISLQLLLAALLVGAACSVLLYAVAPWIAGSMYRLPELNPLIRYLCPSVLLMSLQQVLSGMIAGLGRQKQALYGTLAGAGVTLLSSWYLTGMAELRLYGAAFSMIAGQAVGLVWSIILLIRILMKKAPPRERLSDQQASTFSDT
jgi:stage V sporulation protein B